MKSRRFAALALAIAVTAASDARADGYYEGTKGARASGRAGAFMVRADDLSGVQLNPAGLGHVDGTMFQLGNRISHNAHRFTRDATVDHSIANNPPTVTFDEVENQTPWQALDPALGAASDFGLDNWRLALAIYAPAGTAAQEFPVDGGQRYMMVSRDAKVINYTANVAFTEKDVFGVGASLQWIAVPELKYELVVDAEYFAAQANPVQSALDMLVTIEGSDVFTPNLVLGAWYRPASFLEVGLSGQVLPVEMEADSTLSVEPLAPMIEDEVILRRGSERADDVTLTLPLPLALRAGIRYIQHEGGRELFDIEFNVSYEAWSAVRSFTLETRGLEAELFGRDIPIDTIEIEKHWNDTITLNLGGDYAVVADLLSARAGLFYESALAPPEYLHVDFVSGSQLGGALGVSLLLGDFELALAYEYRHSPEARVAENEARVYQEVPASQCMAPYTDTSVCNENYLGQPAPAVNAGRYSAASNVVSIDLLYRL